ARRRAVCIGIDKYAGMPLDGCVNDSRAWEKELKKAGFTVTSLHDGQATRQRMLDSLTSLLKDSDRGDQLVFQYAGHGTQVPDLDGDEVDRFDEALVPFDYRDGELLTDDDIYRVCAQLREKPGVTLTFFMDCCNSGSNTRVAALPRPGAKQKVRFLKLSSDVVQKYQDVRRSRGTRAAALPPVNEREPQPGVVSFAACLDHEFAFETEGHGDFTTRATGVFERTLANGGSNQAFITDILKAFGATRRQNPTLLDPAPGLKQRRFLGGR
ncbi:MAG TPA: caspase family protein, partial [Luteitalea sp.]|nr:caspase family protein [Luteitalea sp.]